MAPNSRGFGGRRRDGIDPSRIPPGLAISYRCAATGKLMPAHVYCSNSFEDRFAWRMTGRADAMIRASLIDAARGHLPEAIAEADMRGRVVTLEIEPLRTPQAVFALFTPTPVKGKLREIVRPWRHAATSPVASGPFDRR